MSSTTHPPARSPAEARGIRRRRPTIVLLAMVLFVAPVVTATWPASSHTAGAASPAISTGCPGNETCLLVVQVSNPGDPSCDYGCPTGDAIDVTATGLRSNIPGDYVPPTDFIVIYEVPSSGANCVGVVGTDNGCIEVQSCAVARAVCSITLPWSWDAAYPGDATTHVFEAWAINTAGNYPDYCSGKTWFQYSTSYIYPYLGAGQLGLTNQAPAGAPGSGVAETATSVPEGTPVTVRTYATDPPFYDSNFSTYQCSDDSNAPPGVAACTTLPNSYTYPNDQQFATPSTSGYAGCNSRSIPAPPGWSWPSPLTDNGPFTATTPTTRFYISSQAVYIADPASNNVPCIGLSAAQPQIGVSNWLSVDWFCPPTVVGLNATEGSGQTAVDGSEFATPLAALVVNSCTGQGLPGSAVTFTMPPGAASFAGGAASETDVTGPDGVATTSTVTAGETPRSFDAQATDGGFTAAFALTDTCNAAWGDGLALVSGSPQSAAAGTDFAQPLIAKAVNQCGAPLGGADVTFSVPGARASFTGTQSGSVDAVSGVDGTASSGTVLAAPATTQLGAYPATAVARYPGPFSPSTPVTYDLDNLCNAGIATGLAIAGGNDQTAEEGAPFAPLSVDVTSQCATPYTSGSVSFVGPATTAAPGVSFATPDGATSVAVPTDPTGRATSPVPYADEVAGPLVVAASVPSDAGAAAPSVDFSLTIVPAGASGPVILPTAQRFSSTTRRGSDVSAAPSHRHGRRRGSGDGVAHHPHRSSHRHPGGRGHRGRST